LDPRPVALNALLAGSGGALSRVLGPGVELRFDLDPGLPPCVADPARVEAALLDLLANARDAMPGGGRATVRTGTAVLDEAAVAAGGDGLKPGRYVVLAVEDDGPGMPPAVLARAAEPFFTTKPGKGTGLGLAMVHGFVRQSGGRLEISSEPGRGTAVRMLFPAASGDAAAAAPPRLSRAEPVLDPRGRAETVLVVDDDEDVLDLAVHHLGILGYAMLSARSGEEALEVLERTGGRIDLVFTDLSMPGGMNGLVLAERAREKHPGLPVLLATGYNEDLASGLRQEAEVRKALERAGRASEQAAKLTRQLVTFARKTRLEPRAVVLNGVLADFGDMLAHSLGGEIHVRYELEPGLPPCVVDPTHAEMALLNVLANARDAMPGGGRATVRPEAVSLDEAAASASGGGLKPGLYVALSVEDEGPGMPPAVLARAAEPFFTTKKGKGTGLGLAMAHGFVRQSGGRLEISSEPGRGTAVRMLFPAASGDAAADAAPRLSRAEPVLDPRGRAETVLVVDDD
ncbi:MAG: response regulator, partial [Acetobacteraceae bacterium]|nr:response regulator [Acetobacteraceae bacterium]